MINEAIKRAPAFPPLFVNYLAAFVAIAEGDVEYYGNKCHSFASMMMVIAVNTSNPEEVRVTSMEWLCHYAACHAWSNEVATKLFEFFLKIIVTAKPGDSLDRDGDNCTRFALEGCRHLGELNDKGIPRTLL